MVIDLTDIQKGLPGLTSTSGQHLYEGCIVCLTRQKHSYLGTTLKLIDSNSQTKEYMLKWEDIFTEQLERTWKDQFYATEHGALCIAILLALELTEYTIIEKSARQNGFDYWLGLKNDDLFQKKARLEVSGIFTGNSKDINTRYKVKLDQTDKSDNLQIPAYIGIVEFSKPQTKFGKKK